MLNEVIFLQQKRYQKAVTTRDADCGAVTFLVGSGSGSGSGSEEVFRLRLRLRLRVKLFGGSDSGSGSGQNVPAPAAPAQMLKSSYSLNQQYDFEKCQLSKYDLLLT